MHIGYLVSRYPAVSHTFIQREILGLRRLGWTVTTFSVRKARPAELLSAADRDEFQNTVSLLPAAPAACVAALCRAVLTPRRFLAAARAAWSLRRPGLRGALWAFFYLAEALLVHRLCALRGIRHLHAHFANVAADVALLASILNAGTFSFTMHGPTEFADVETHRLARKAAAARCVCCISDFARSQLMALLPMEQWGKLEVLHCGIDPEQFQGPRTPTPATAELLVVARLAPVKGHAVLLRAVAELLMRGQDVRLTIAGDGPLRQSLERLADVLGIAERVTFLGNVGQDEIAGLYKRAALFVLPSFAEGVPVVLMEAMAARCPVLATRIAGIPELIEDGVTGKLVAPGRDDLLADAIERLLLNRHAAARMAETALEKVRREFNIIRIAPQLAGIYEKYLLPRATGRMAPRAGIDGRRRARDYPPSEPSPRARTFSGVSESSEQPPRGAA